MVAKYAKSKIKWIYVNASEQKMECYNAKLGDKSYLWQQYAVSTAKNGLGEQINSECTPRGWHEIHSVIGAGYLENSVFVSRVFKQ